MKYALLITQDCNLRCNYCYINKKKSAISLQVARKAIDFVFSNSEKEEKICIGFFGGEPLLEFERLKEITSMIENHPGFPERDVEIQVTSNGTIFSNAIADYLNEHSIGLGISCDGILQVQNENRRFIDGRPSSEIVEKNIEFAASAIPGLMINAVFTPSTYYLLPENVEYFYSMGLRRIFINPDFSSKWSMSDAADIQNIYHRLTEKYLHWHEADDPAFISLIDGKIILIMNKGYQVNERCQMGKKEFAIAPNGNVFPCERLLGDGSVSDHCLGNIFTGIDYRKFCTNKHFSQPVLSVCSNCSLKKYCMHWCGCSNFFSTGSYNQPGPFICASEKAAINAALVAFENLEARYGALLIDRISGKNCEKAHLQSLK